VASIFLPRLCTYEGVAIHCQKAVAFLGKMGDKNSFGKKVN
jgi:hypothetical protein